MCTESVVLTISLRNNIFFIFGAKNLTMPLKGVFVVVVLGLASTAIVVVDSHDTEIGSCEKYKGDKNHKCVDGFNVVYREKIDDLNAMTLCCTKNSKAEKGQLAKLSGCFVTDCMDARKTRKNNMCPERTIKEKVNVYAEVARDKCHKGMEALCCPPDSQEGMLAALLTAELHQFPHYALIYTVDEAKSTHYCGGTIYNERHIITASHCFVEKTKLQNTDGAKVKLDVRISDKDSLNTYEVEKFIIHPKSSLWKTDALPIKNDIAIVKLKKDIKFGPNVQALPIAKPGFTPMKYGDEALLMGIGYTDTLLRANLLQRARVWLRDDERNLKGQSPFKGKFTDKEADSVMFIGGMQDGKNSPRSAHGDSGGSAICRDENGMAILCGVNSAGPDLNICEEKLDDFHCAPAAYMEVQHYYNWVVKEAGDQKKAQVMHQPLFGAPVPRKMYPHQVHITTPDGSCGGTLIEQDKVVTAAHCVVDDNGDRKDNVKVVTGLRDIKSTNGKELGIKDITALDGFKRRSSGSRRKRIARLNVMPSPNSPYYRNDLAVIKLSEKADIDAKLLPKIGRAPESDGNTEDVTWITEIAFPSNSSRSGKLQQRDFQILERNACQKRLDRASKLGFAYQVDENVLCGQEKYNGGAQCDRELGGGLICKGEKGEDVLCGVQVFRFCQLALPSAFLDVTQHKDFLKK